MLPGEEYQIYPVSGGRRRPRGVKDEKETRDLRGGGGGGDEEVEIIVYSPKALSTRWTQPCPTLKVLDN